MKDPRIEQFLKGNGVSFKYVEEVPLSKIVVDSGAREQIRLETGIYDEETVLRYMVSYQHGDRLPASVIFSIPVGRYAYIYGLNRGEAYDRLGVKATDAYVVDVELPKDEAVISRLRRSINGLNGRPLGVEETLQQALHLVKEGMLPVDAAKQMRLKPSRVYKQISYEKGVERLGRESGLKPGAIGGMSVSMIVEIDKERNPKIAGQMTLLAWEAHLNAAEVVELSRQVRAATTDDAKEAVLLKWREEYKDRCKWPGLTQPVSRLRNLKLYGQKVHREMQSESMKALQKKDRVEAVRFLKRLRAQIDAVIRRLEGNGTSAVRRHRASGVVPSGH